MTVALIDPVDLYSEVNRAVKYGFMFIGFTFLMLLMFDVIGGVPVAGVAYLLVGSGLILFFVLLLAFAEIIGFTPAYLIASGAIIGLVGCYAAAVLHSWRRAGAVAALLTGALRRALRPAQPRSLFAADRLAAAVRGAGGGDVFHPQRRLATRRRPARTRAEA